MSGFEERFLFACAPDSWGVLDYPGPVVGAIVRGRCWMRWWRRDTRERS